MSRAILALAMASMRSFSYRARCKKSGTRFTAVVPYCCTLRRRFVWLRERGVCVLGMRSAFRQAALMRSLACSWSKSASPFPFPLPGAALTSQAQPGGQPPSKGRPFATASTKTFAAAHALTNPSLRCKGMGKAEITSEALRVPVILRVARESYLALKAAGARAPLWHR